MSATPLSVAASPPSGPATPHRTTSKVVFSCSTCGRKSAALSSAHCSVCHRHFIAASAFDDHRRGPIHARYCEDPAQATRRDGTPMFELVEMAHGSVWRRARRAHETVNPFGAKAVAA